ncbi:cytochrome P450 [Phytoactinopolyspora halotolerans]|uniref:Cytochrome P450 n=1 Tax=Phytoactinopolyspora halotolerans TaxID=1981512 RepID=A0A6L9S7W4_9ACTN|nr:cytochrome P450 [Phytoactinopolyspora halotolerans]NEE01266.1 cytochrome P450 [Phytoactinopolyspora halotolerans]
MHTTTVPVSQIDPFDETVLADPYPAHRELRDLGAVVWLERYRVWGMARHEQVEAALNDPQTFCSARGVGLSDFHKEKPWRPPSLLLEADPPDHTRARHTITQVLSPVAVRGLREAFTAEASALFDRLAGRTAIDGVRDIAEAFPLTVFPDVVGLPPDGREHLLPYGGLVFNGFGPRNRLFLDALARAEHARDWIAAHCRRENLADGGLGAQIHRTAAAEGYTAADAALLVRSFLSAGVDTTVHGIGNALLCLAENPDQFRVLRADPTQARKAFEETIRYESPVQTFFRTTTRDVDVAGATIPAGEKVLLFLAAANRDPRRWEAADTYDITRKASGHVGFGFGVHACVGQMLARLEGEIVLTELARRAEAIELAGPPKRQLSNTLRGLDSLPLSVAWV